MKKIFTYTFLLFLFHSAQGQTLALPNFSFESWTSGVPNNWVDQNGGGSITETSPGYASANAVKGTMVTSPSDYTPTLVSQSGGFPITMQYQYLRFYYKTNLVSGGGGQDKVFINIDIRDASNASIGYSISPANTITANATVFTEKQIRIYYNTGTPAKANVTFTVQPTGSDPYAHLGTWFVIDSVSLSNLSIGINEIEETNKLQIYPNPVHEKLNIQTEATQAMQITLSDAIGNIVLHRLSSEPVNGLIEDAINTESLSSGLYILMLTSDKKTILRRVMVN